MRRGTKEVQRFTKANTYMAAGVVTNSKLVGCPPCDTVYISLVRDHKEVLFMAVTPDEAHLLRELLLVAAARAGGTE